LSRRIIFRTALILAVASLATTRETFAQSAAAINPASRIVIEVASIRPSNPDTCGEYPIIDNHGDRYDMRCVKAKFLLQTAFSVRDFQVIGGPNWLRSTQYDIAAKITGSSIDSGVPEKSVAELTDQERKSKGERLRAVLQSLLTDRFQLKQHSETKQLPVYLLEAAKGGPKLKVSANSSDVSGGLRLGTGFLAGTQTDVPFLARTLSQIVGRPISDRTGLSGKYDFELKWTPDQSSATNAVGGVAPPLAVSDPDRPNIFTALQEQLGLKLDPSKGPVTVIVVDHIETPSAN
jgi:bla regulator protein blaR1